jgi:hypothetical protein
MILTGNNEEYPNRKLFQCHFPTKHFSRPGLPLNWGLRGERQQDCGLSHGTALTECKSSGTLRVLDIRNIPEDLNLHQRRCANQKSRKFCFLYCGKSMDLVDLFMFLTIRLTNDSEHTKNNNLTIYKYDRLAERAEVCGLCTVYDVTCRTV